MKLGRKGDSGDPYPIRWPGIGLPGFDGPSGRKGEAGIEGFQGRAGLGGRRGFKGVRGDVGYIGYQGAEGVKGEIGLPGPRGIFKFEKSVEKFIDNFFCRYLWFGWLARYWW